MIEMKNVYKKCNNDFMLDFANPQNVVQFSSAEEAWFWFCKYNGRRNGYKRISSVYRIFRPCSLDDIYIVVARLFLSGVITKEQLAILLKYGKYQIVPDMRIFDECEDALLWREAIAKLEKAFIEKGIVRVRNKVEIMQ